MNLMLFLPGANSQAIKEFAQVLGVEERALPLVKAKDALPVLEEHYNATFKSETLEIIKGLCQCTICLKAREIVKEIRIALANQPNDNN